MFVTLGLTGIVDVAATNMVSLFGALIPGTFTLVSITISINQLILSRILESPKGIQKHMQSVHEFRQEIEKMGPGRATDPTDPPPFLRLLAKAVEKRAGEVDQAFQEGDPGWNSVADLVDRLSTEHARVQSRIGNQPPDDLSELFSTLSALKERSYFEYLHSARAVRSVHHDELSDRQRRALSDFADALEQLTIARHFLKTSTPTKRSRGSQKWCS